MLNSQKIAVQMSEKRQRLNELLGLEVEKRAEDHADELGRLTAEMQAHEIEYRAALTAEDTSTTVEETPADPARAELEQRAQLSGILSGIMSGRGATGAEAELQAELKLDGDQVPLALLEQRAEVEHRTTGQTPAPGKVGASQRPIIPAVFPRSASAYLGVRMPTVGVGEEVFTVLTANLEPGTPSAGADQDHSAGAFTPKTLSPHRIQGSFFIRREDRAKLAGMESALRMNLSDAMSSKMDAEVIAGTQGFLGAGLTVRTGDAGATATYATYRALLFDSATVDGLYAYTAGDIRLLVGADTYAHAAGVYRGDHDNTDALAALRRDAGGVQVSSHIPAAGNDNDQDVIVAKDVGREHAVAPIWEGVQVIVDEVTQAKAGEIVFTAVMLWGRLAVLRSAAFVRRAVQVA